MEMRRLVTGKQMKEIDGYAIRKVGIPSLVLMERAALAVADEMEKRYGKLSGQRLLVFCGTGNNGADGAALARILFLRGALPTVLTVGDKAHWTGEMTCQVAIDRNLGIPVEAFENYVPGHVEIMVDAIFGVGLSREVGGEFAEAIRFMREQEPKAVVAVDIPSGVSSETGAALGEAVEADLTVTFGYEKLGMVFYPGRKLCGEIVIADIGFPAYTKYEGHTYFAYDSEDQNQIPKRRADANKGTYGKILIAAGSEGMCGAAYLSALAAYRMGAGLVKILTVRANVPILQNLLPEAILTPYDPEQAQTDPAGFKSLVEQECGWASAIVLGPGLGKEAHVASLVQNVLLSAYVPIIVDADGLNAVAQHPHLSGYFTENVIVTPHLGEMARLTGRSIEELKRDLVESAVRYGEEKGVTCVLKDAVTVTAGRDGNVYIGDSGCAAMAKGGSGDVLTGVIAGLLALGFSEDEAAALGVFLHGRAGAAAACKKGEHSVLARDIADCLLEKID